jgi:hypothetical protein
MINILRESLWKQFGACIDMFENAIRHCSDELLTSNKRIFYLIYHNLVFFDYYMTIPPKDFTAVLPFTLKEQPDIPEDAVDDVIPNRFYSRDELLEYLRASREKCKSLILALTEEKLNQRFREEPGQGAVDYSLVEILFYNMRHVQHHVGQLNLILRQFKGEAPGWVQRAGDNPFKT